MAEQRDGVIWDLTSYFPEFNGPEMVAFFNVLKQDVADLQELAAGLKPLSMDNALQWEEVVVKTEDALARMQHMFSYVNCLTSAHADNEEYAQEEAKLSRLVAEFEKLDVDTLRAFKDASDEVFDAFLAREMIAPIAHYLRRTRIRAQRTMSRPQELLAAVLNVDGFHSWGRLYDRITGKLEFDMTYPDGRVERTPISKWRSLMSDADREIGRAAFDGGNKAWAGIEDVCAAALNAIAGTRLTMNKYRGVDHFLWWALFQSQVSQETLDAMYQAIHENIELAREVFRTKAKHFGRTGIWWFEREAPLPLEDTARFSWKEGAEMVAQAFGEAYPNLAQYYDRFLQNRWLESEARGGKRPGAFCTGSEMIQEQRVFMTFNGSLSDVTTIAHEVGHAFHSHVMRDLRPLAQFYPMTLAETASIFAEQLLAEGIYADSKISDAQKLLMLDADLCGAAVLLLDITIRFEFEKAFYEERQQGEVSVSRLKELMVEAQRRVFGDALLPDGDDPLFWASKLHFYITHVTFYNFPYTFGFLLSRALTGMFQEHGDAFLPRYEEFLRLTGSGSVEEVARRGLEVDVRDPAFWKASINSLAAPLERYKELLAKLKSSGAAG